MGSSTRLLSPRVRGGPPTFGLGAVALLGTDALVAGSGAEPRVRPCPSKLSLDCFPQRLPMCNARGGAVLAKGDGGQRAARGAAGCRGQYSAVVQGRLRRCQPRRRGGVRRINQLRRAGLDAKYLSLGSPAYPGPFRLVGVLPQARRVSRPANPPVSISLGQRMATPDAQSMML